MFVCHVLDVAFLETGSLFVHAPACLQDTRTCVSVCVLTLIPKRDLRHAWFWLVNARILTDGLADVQKEEHSFYHEIPRSLLEIYGHFAEICHRHVKLAGFSETLANMYQTTHHHILEVFFVMAAGTCEFHMDHIPYLYAINVEIGFKYT
jgi:hypothetical protein